MYPFTNSIKATRLWHLTGKQHFKSIVEDRRTARSIDLQHDKKNFATIYGIALLSTLAVSYSFGLFKPKKYISPYTDPVNIDKGPILCTEATKTPCPHTPKDFMPPCPCRDICGDEKPSEKKLIKKAKKERFIKQKQLSREYYKKKLEEEEKEKIRQQEIQERRKKRLAEGRPCDCD